MARDDFRVVDRVYVDDAGEHTNVLYSVIGDGDEHLLGDEIKDIRRQASQSHTGDGIALVELVEGFDDCDGRHLDHTVTDEPSWG